MMIVFDKYVIGIGFDFTMGVMLYFASGYVLFYGLQVFFTKFDNTDAPKKRSGLKIKIDNETGVNYLENQSGDLILRINADGTPYVSKGGE